MTKFFRGNPRLLFEAVPVALKSEQATMRRLVIRMDTMRRTSYVSAGYLIAEITFW